MMLLLHTILRFRTKSYEFMQIFGQEITSAKILSLMTNITIVRSN